MSTRMLVATALLLLNAEGLDAQAANFDKHVGSDSATLAGLRVCPRAQCALTLERGTIDGTRLRIGSSETLVPVGLTGSRVYSRLTVVPAAVAEATAGRNALRENTLLTTGALVMTALVWIRVAPKDRGAIATRLAIVMGIGVLSIPRWHHNARVADAHFENAVRLYNEVLPP
jgi:hypothetical protein